MKHLSLKIKALAVLTGIAACLLPAAQAQEKEYPEPEPMRPGMSEYWTPQPRIVTPGDILTHSAPSDAIVLFDGKDLSQWEEPGHGEARWIVHDGIVTVNKKAGDIRTKENFGSFQLHLEWSVPKDIEGESQAGGNSGVIIQDRYEVQILDNYENETYVNGMVASVYKQTPPAVNAMRAPGEWNVYDIIYTAPIFKEDGSYLYPPRVTVLHNNVVVQCNTIIQGSTQYIGFPKVSPHGEGPIRLQMHGDPSKAISFRNIWVRKL